MLNATIAHRKLSDSFARPWLIECDDNNKYAVKFANEKNDNSIINEFVCAHLLKKLDLPIASPELIQISQELIEKTQDLRERNIKPGIHFGLAYVDGSLNLSDQSIQKIPIEKIQNASQVPGMIAFDIFVCNIDRSTNNSLITPIDDTKDKYRYVTIDHGHCFGGPSWNEPSIRNLPLQLGAIPWKKDLIRSVADITPYINKLEGLSKTDFQHVVDGIPPEWNKKENEITALVDVLEKRNETSILNLLKDNKVQFPNWSRND